MKSSDSISSTQRRALHFLKSFNLSGFKFFYQEITLINSLFLAFCIGLLYIFYLFPYHFLKGDSGLFERLEPLTSLSGWQIFKHSPWRFPLLKAPTLNAPEGINIAFTNSIPLLALVFKPFTHLLSKDFHYFGLWFAFSAVAQAMSATLAIRALGQKTLLAATSAAMFALMMPVFLWQTDNIPLIFQAYLFFALALYFIGFNHQRFVKEVTNAFALLLTLALLTHPYLLLMTSVFYIAFLANIWMQSSKNHQLCLTSLLVTSLSIGITLLIGGYFSQILKMQGYSTYSMNLAAPFSGGNLGWRVVLATKGQLRGFNYLGMGTLLALIVTVLDNRKRLLDTLTRHRFLVGILLFLTIISLSNHVFYGKQLLIRYPLFFPFSLISDIFRSSGRLFWPCGYTLALIGLLGVLKLPNKQLSFLMTFLVLGVQFYDTLPLRASLYRAVRTPTSTTHNWNRLVNSISAIQLYPAYGCGEHSTENIVFWQSLAARNRRAINTAYRANKKIHCPTKHAAFSKPLVKDQLYVVSNKHQRLPHHISLAMDQGWCRKTTKGIICVKNTDYDWWKTYLPQKEIKQSILKAKTKVKKKKKYDWGWPESD